MPPQLPRDEVLREMIAAANARYNHMFGQTWTDAQIDALLDRAYPFEPEVRRRLARETASQLSKGAQSYEHKFSHAKLHKKIVKSQPLSDYLGGLPAEGGTIGVTFFWEGEDSHHNPIHGSVVLNVPAGVNDTLLEARGCAYALWASAHGSVTPGLVSLTDCGIATITPYARHGGIDLDVDPITKTHPNPYPTP